jgi:hypothetical protein
LHGARCAQGQALTGAFGGLDLRCAPRTRAAQAGTEERSPAEQKNWRKEGFDWNDFRRGERYAGNSILSISVASLARMLAASSPALAQQKTVKMCQEEWRANKAANQANKITEKAYVEQCRAGNSSLFAPSSVFADEPLPISRH